LTEPQHASTGNRPKPAVLVGVGVGVLVVLGLVAVLVFRGKSNPGAQVSSSPSAGFQFVNVKVDPLATAAGADQKKTTRAATPIASLVTQQLNTLYGQGFLNPADWQQGKYDTALVVFDPGALTAAQKQLGELTAGTAAGSTYSSIAFVTTGSQPDQADLKVEVLLDKSNKPVSAVGIVKFTATAKGKDGSTVTLKSQGQYIFRDVGGTWKIVSFNVTRDDQQVTATPTTPTGSASP
jgi:hypothetical protein